MTCQSDAYPSPLLILPMYKRLMSRNEGIVADSPLLMSKIIRQRKCVRSLSDDNLFVASLIVRHLGEHTLGLLKRSKWVIYIHHFLLLRLFPLNRAGVCCQDYRGAFYLYPNQWNQRNLDSVFYSTSECRFTWFPFNF